MKDKMIEQLQAYVQENKLHEKAIEDFWFAFNNWKKDFPKSYKKAFKDFSIDDCDIFVHSIGLRSSQWPDCNFNHVTVGILIHHESCNGHVREVGNYRVFYSLSDDVDDDDMFEIL